MVKVNPYSKQLKEQEELKASLEKDKQYYRIQLESSLKQLGYMILQKKMDSFEGMYIPRNWLQLYKPYQSKKEYIKDLKNTFHWLNKIFRELDQCERQMIYLKQERDKLDYIKCEEKE